MKIVICDSDRLRDTKKQEVPIVFPVRIGGIDIAAIEVVPGKRNIRRGEKAADNHLTPDIVKSVVIDPHQVGSCNCNSITGKYHAFIDITDGQVANNDVADPTPSL
ncbi:hypothetical protein ACFQX9_16995 [Bradyrhizobium sp. GCM10028915]|uniref:hypothetical protein n=1 Tax=Bradyrhizobium sp. GCM10028915 TaxID=3273385 RepID=UPI001FDA5A61|nr:hypothetical protein [Bradyrhizobium sp. WSM1253]